jgi:type II secretory pathway pseudopilin PulG
MPAATLFSADPPARSRAAFSLIEIILAVAVIAFALTAILGLFPVAVGAATDSQRETQSALIARSILDQLAARPGSATRYFTLETNSASSMDLPQMKIPIDSANTYRNAAVLDSDGRPLSGGISDPRMTYAVDIAIAPLATPSDSLSQVTVTVKTRSPNVSYPFTTLLSQK